MKCQYCACGLETNVQWRQWWNVTTYTQILHLRLSRYIDFLLLYASTTFRRQIWSFLLDIFHLVSLVTVTVQTECVITGHIIYIYLLEDCCSTCTHVNTHVTYFYLYFFYTQLNWTSDAFLLLLNYCSHGWLSPSPKQYFNTISWLLGAFYNTNERTDQ